MIKILAIGDPHGKLPKNLSSIIKKSKIDLIICVGDIPPVPVNFRKNNKTGSFSPAFKKMADKSYKTIIKRLCSYKIPVLTLRGNMYLGGEHNKFTKRIFNKYKNLHHKRTGKSKINGIDFVFFDMIWEPHYVRSTFQKSQARSNSSREKKINKLLKGNKGAIILSHSPPHKVLDKTTSGKHIGSKILLRAIKKHKPKLVLCGHIHEAKGEKKIGKTKVINLGESRYKVIKL